MKNSGYCIIFCSILLASCINKSSNQQKNEPVDKFSVGKDKITLMTLDPGHFHAALVQKTSYDEMNDTVFVYAPKGEDIKDHLIRIEGFNTREENPTQWIENVYTGSDYLEKMIAEKPGNVMMVSGKNNKKIEYIKAAIDAGINVYADKPLVINPKDFPMLEEVFKIAAEKNLLVYDIMTERFEITTILQRALSMTPEVFGTLIEGSVEEPAITKESVHHFFKYVSGKPLKRPEWFFDTQQRGEGLNDVSTHLVDLIQWEAFPNQKLNKNDIQIVDAKHWTTELTKEMYSKVTGADSFPDFLKKDVVGNRLNIFCNGSITYKIKDKFAKTSVIWNFQAMEGTGDTHNSIMRGTQCDLIIKQGAEENYKPQLYIKLNSGDHESLFESRLKNMVETTLSNKYQGLKLHKLSDKLWTLDIPQIFKISHEAHFGQVTKNYLKYLENGTLPEWEVSNMIVKYYTTSEALKFVNK